jgi:hypothetical protein
MQLEKVYEKEIKNGEITIEELEVVKKYIESNELTNEIPQEVYKTLNLIDMNHRNHFLWFLEDQSLRGHWYRLWFPLKDMSNKKSQEAREEGEALARSMINGLKTMVKTKWLSVADS